MINIKEELEKSESAANDVRLNDLDLEPSTIRAIMINEVVPADPAQDFYGPAGADYMKTTIPLFQKAGINVSSIEEILQMGIYVTNAVKTPKMEYTIEKSSIEKSLPYLEQEIALFPEVRVIMLMGDVAKKAYNMITKKTMKKNAVPAVSTYKLRNTEIHLGDIRVMPSYIMTGGNILIEKSKFEMAAEDIAVMAEIIR